MEVSVDEALHHIRIVLVRPQGAANVGAVARAMKNMGLRDLALVGTSRRRVAAAATTAVRAVDLLERAPRCASIADAVAGCNLVVGTSAQGGLYRADPESPEEVADDILSVARRGRVAIVFGPEHHGLTREDLVHCHRLIRIDTALDYTSINLAQAVLVVCYELRRRVASASKTSPSSPTTPNARPVARAEEIHRLESKMTRALLDIGFLNPQNPDRVMFVLRRMIGRAILRPIEVRILMGMARRMQWSATAADAAKRAGVEIDASGAAEVDEEPPSG